MSDYFELVVNWIFSIPNMKIYSIAFQGWLVGLVQLAAVYWNYSEQFCLGYKDMKKKNEIKRNIFTFFLSYMYCTPVIKIFVIFLGFFCDFF